MTVLPKGSLALGLAGTMCILAAVITQVFTLTWRNWIQMPIPWHNGTARLQLGLWGACVHDDHCYAFHSEGQSLPWQLQMAVFLSMICICMEVLILALCLVEMVFIWNRRKGFPLKKLELYMALVGALLAVTISAVMGLLAISGQEQEVWDLLRERMLLGGPNKLAIYSRFSVSQAWGFQVLSCMYFICYMFIARIMLTQRVIRVEVSVEEEERNGRRGGPGPRTPRNRISIISPSFPNGVGSRTPPPAYSPPPAYDSRASEEQETCLIVDQQPAAVVAPARTEDTSSFTLLL